MSRCESRLVRAGRQCSRPARPGQTTCAQHGRSPEPRAAGSGARGLTDRVGRHAGSITAAADRIAATGDGFYTSAMEAAEQYDLAAAASVSGVDGEIALLRLVIRRAILDHPEDLARLVRAIETLTKTVRVKYQISEKRRENLAEAMAAVLEELGAAAGLTEQG